MQKLDTILDVSVFEQEDGNAVYTRTGMVSATNGTACTGCRQTHACIEKQARLPDVVSLLLLNEQADARITIASSVPEDCTSLHPWHTSWHEYMCIYRTCAAGTDNGIAIGCESRYVDERHMIVMAQGLCI